MATTRFNPFPLTMEPTRFRERCHTLSMLSALVLVPFVVMFITIVTGLAQGSPFGVEPLSESVVLAAVFFILSGVIPALFSTARPKIASLTKGLLSAAFGIITYHLARALPPIPELPLPAIAGALSAILCDGFLRERIKDWLAHYRLVLEDGN